MNDSLISSIEILPLNLPLNEPFSIATGQQDEVKNVLIKVTLANGVIGLGEAAPFPAVSGETQESAMLALEYIKKNLLNTDIRSWKRSAEALTFLMGKESAAVCGMQMALADTLARYYNIPLYILFGGASETLTTDMTITSSDVEHARNSAKAIIQRGINTVKIKTAGKDVDFDFERIKAAHGAAPQAALTLDGNCGYSYDGAMALVSMLRAAKIPVEFFEQPFPREEWELLSAFTKNSGIKVAADESARNAEDVLRIVQQKSAHIINIKLMKCGLFEAIRMVEIAKAAGLELMIGGMVETILSMSFSAHFAIGLGGFAYADLDTPLFIKSHPFKGGFDLNGDIISLNKTAPGHGTILA